MGAVDTTYTFQATDTITSSKMNNIIDQTTITSDAIFGNTLEVVSGKLKIRSQGVTSTELASDSVTSTAIVSGSVDPTKLSTGYPAWTTTGNLTIGGNLISNGSSTALSSVSAGTASVSIGSARTASGASNIDFNSTFPLTSYEARISRESGADGNLVISNTGNGSIKFNGIPLGVQAGTAPIYGARAWASVDGLGTTQITGSAVRVAASTTVTISKASHGFSTGDRAYFLFTATNILDGVYAVTYVDSSTFTVTTVVTTAAASANVTWWDVPVLSSNSNISSIKGSLSGDPTGAYFVNFKIPMPNANYAVNLTGDNDDGRCLMTNPAYPNTANGFVTKFRTTGNSPTNLLFYLSVFA